MNRPASCGGGGSLETWKGNRKMIKKIFAAGLLFAGMLISAAPVFQPMVKEYRPENGSFRIAGLPVFYEDNKQCEIGASEVQGAGEKKMGLPDSFDKGIFIFTLETEAGKDLAAKYDLKVPERKQGYAIRAQNGKILIAGFDRIGALYGAVTLQQMIEGGSVQNATVRDYPDILYRGGMSMMRGIGRLANGDVNREKGFKAGVDFLLRHKLNSVCDYFGVDMKSSPATLDFVGKINQYALDRGIYPNPYPSTALYTISDKPAGMTPAKWHCVADFRGQWLEHYHCWADDAETEAAAERYAAWLEKIHGGGIIVIHPVDGGAITDPEMWSRRCATCRARWKDDERWKASARQLEIWNKVFRRHFPQAVIGSCVYPYVIGLLDTQEKDRTPVFRQNVTEFWTKLSRAMNDRDFFFSSWIVTPRLFGPYRALVGKRPLHFSDTYPTSAGIFSTYHRFAGSVYEPGSENIFSTQGTDGYGQWESLCLVAEHAWNRNAPGNEIYDGGTYYDGLKDHTGPKVIMEETLPRICYTFWGKELAPFMVRIFSSGIMPGYIGNPDGTINYFNRVRRDATYDPAGGSAAGKQKKPSVTHISDNTVLMQQQVRAAELVVSELEKARKHLNGLDPYKRKYFMYFAKNAPYWLATARALSRIREGNDLAAAGRNQEAIAVLESGLKQLKSDFAAADANSKALRSEPDTGWPFRTTLDKATLEKAFVNAIDSAKVTLQPRRIGRFVKVGILKGDAAKGIKEYLDTFSNVKATVISNISLAELDRYDCIFVPASSYDKSDFFRNFKAYVEQGGGGVVFEGALCGHSRFYPETPFPEIVKNAPERIDHFSREAVWKDGIAVKTMYVDFFSPVPGKKGEVIAKTPKGIPVAVQGSAGLGKVIFNGSNSIEGVNNSYNVGETKLFGMNARLAKYAIEYFTGIQLKEKNGK